MVAEVLALTPEKPLFGHKSGKKMGTHWVAFLKPNAAGELPTPADYPLGSLIGESTPHGHGRRTR